MVPSRVPGQPFFIIKKTIAFRILLQAVEGMNDYSWPGPRRRGVLFMKICKERREMQAT